MADHRIVPQSILDDRTRAAVDVAERAAELDLVAVLIYRNASVAAEALFPLAWQFSMLGFDGWDLVTTADERRDLLKNALERHRFRGTPWGMLDALRVAGYTAAVIEEHVEGQFNFRVLPRDLPWDGEIPATEQVVLVGIVEAWQNARSHFCGLHFSQPAFSDDVGAEPIDEEPMTITQREYYLHDAANDYDGAITYGGGVSTDLGAI